MNANLHLDDDLASYLKEQAEQEHTTLDEVLNRLLRRVVPGKQLPTQPSPNVNPSRQRWLNRLAERRDRGRTAVQGSPLQQIMDELHGD
jgi:antitoxin component of RelBE/YafQ-DinJ toxin-antitoxin module